MKWLKTYKIFESVQEIESIVEKYISESEYDLEKSLGNCAFFAKDFYEWCVKNKINCDLLYLKLDEDFIEADEIEDHIIIKVNGYLIDFVYSDNGVSKRWRNQNESEALKSQIKPNIISESDFNKFYSKFGYFEIEEISYDDAFGSGGRCLTIDYPKKSRINFIK
jgi:hypothetical protein